MITQSQPSPVLSAFQAHRAVVDGDPDALKRILAAQPQWTAAWSEVIHAALKSNDAAHWELLKSAWPQEPLLWRQAASAIIDEIDYFKSDFPNRPENAPTKAQLANRALDILQNSPNSELRAHVIKGLLEFKRPHQIVRVISTWAPADRQAVWKAGKDVLPVSIRRLDPVGKLSSQQKTGFHRLLDVWFAEAPAAFLLDLIDTRTLNRAYGERIDPPSLEFMNVITQKFVHHPPTPTQRTELQELGSPTRYTALVVANHALSRGRSDILKCLWGQWFSPQSPADVYAGADLCVTAAQLLSSPVQVSAIQAQKGSESALPSVLANWLLSSLSTEHITTAALTLYSKKMNHFALDALVDMLPPDVLKDLKVAASDCPLLSIKQTALALEDATVSTDPSRPNRPIVKM